ncbi:serine hydrolase [Luteitalea sp. TBR-22]|nr:serine hydrolase [Luteitalea sp. TBR-22]
MTGGARFKGVLAVALMALSLVGTRPVVRAQGDAYFPPAGAWASKAPAETGMDAERLADALRYAEASPTTRAIDFSDQEATFGSLLGSVPTRRAGTNGAVIHKGYVVGTFGDPSAVDPTYSVAKSMLSTVTGIAVREGLLRVDDPVGAIVKDGGYDSPRNARVTWAMHLQQESEWEGAMWGKAHDFVGREAFGAGERKPRTLGAPGSFYEYNDVRVNRLALSLLRVFHRPVPEVFRTEVMEPIGASSTWKWVPYHNSYVTEGGVRMASVSGGTRWGGGLWVSAYDLARVGYLWLRGGRWGERQIVPSAYVRAALTPSAHGPDYGYLWWLNTRGEHFPGAPRTAFEALGAGGNHVIVSPGHDLVIVVRWHRDDAAELLRRVIGAIR